MPAFDAALKIVEFLRGLEDERDAEVRSGCDSGTTTPREGTKAEPRWRPLRSSTGDMDEFRSQGVTRP